MTTRDLLLSAWDKDPLFVALCVAIVAAYTWRFRGRIGARSAYFAGAVAMFVVALASPVAILSRGYLFSAHMLQHLILVLVVPPLAILAIPSPRAADAGDHASAPSAPSAPSATPATKRALAPWALGVSAMWLWHEPTLCDAAATNMNVQRVQTLSLLVMGAAFWWPIFAPRASARLPPLAGVVYLFAACVACTILGVIVTFSPIEVCSVFAHPVDRIGAMPLLRGQWGLTPKVDQQIGGLFMWVPACLVYGAAILAVLGRHFAAETEDGVAIPEGERA